ncbi:MAG: hypothetical protein ABIG60_04330 [Patescibacteria group bacterium]
MLKLYNIFIQKEGFGILEVVVSAGIIAIGMVGILSLVIQSNQVYYINKSRFTAVMLAQEGIELTRNVRDSNWKAGSAWDNGIPASFIIDGNFSPSAVAGISNARLYTDANKKYTHTVVGNSPTIFYRLLTTTSPASCPDADDCMKVISQVQWQERGKTHNYQIETYLYDWK